MNSLTYFFIYASLFRNIINLLVRKSTVLGAASIRACDDAIIRRAYADVYIHVPSDELEARLRGRQTDADEVILLRLRNSAEEDARMGEYQFALVSADRESDYSRFTALLTALGMRTPLR